MVRGIPVTAVERTWCDLAAGGMGLAPLVAVGDAILRRQVTRSDLAGIRAAVSRYRGRRGARTIAIALDLLDGRADSAPESEIRVALNQAGLPRPSVGYPIALGDAVVHVDLAWQDVKVALEYEGDYHRTDRDQWHYDIRRYDVLALHGWTVIRATALDYRDPTRLLARVAHALR